jgi:hypothetical protein
MSDPQERVTCPSCSKGYRWQSKLIGRKVTCKQCSTEFEVPIAPGVGISLAPVTDDGTYELDLDAEETPGANHAKPANDGKCPSCNSPVRGGAVLCMNCGFNMAEGKKLETAVAATPAGPEEAPAPSTLTKKQEREMERAAEIHAQHWMMDYKAPIILIIIGFALVLINNLVLAPIAPAFEGYFGSRLDLIVDLTIGTAIGLFINAALLFAGLFVLIWLFGSGFGALGSVLLKVLAITLLTQEVTFFVVIGLDVMFSTGGLGWLIGWAAYITVMIVMCAKFLDVDFTEFRVLFWFILIGRYGAEFILGLVFEGLY